MEYLIAIISILLCGLVAYILLDKNKADKIWFFRSRDNKEELPSKEIKRLPYILLTIALLVVSGVIEIWLMTHISDILNQIKMSIALVCLTGAACNDYREHRIPNRFPLIMAITGIACLAIGYFTNQAGSTSYIFSCLIATVGVSLCLTLASVLTKHGIGFGDIKLLSALALTGGVYTICGTLFFGMVLCAIVAIVLLVMKKKTIKESLPFGPFIYFGFCITVLASIY